MEQEILMLTKRIIALENLLNYSPLGQTEPNAIEAFDKGFELHGKEMNLLGERITTLETARTEQRKLNVTFEVKKLKENALEKAQEKPKFWSFWK